MRPPARGLASPTSTSTSPTAASSCRTSETAESDAAALGLFREVFKDMEIVQVPSRDLLYAGGNIHCITQQEPCDNEHRFSLHFFFFFHNSLLLIFSLMTI